MASIYHDDFPSPFQNGPTPTEEMKIPKYFEAIRHGSELETWSVITAFYCWGSQGKEIKEVLAKSWLTVCPVGSLWILLVVMSPVPEYVIRMETRGIWCNPGTGSLAYWVWAITEGKAKWKPLKLPSLPTLSPTKIVNQKQYHILGMEICAH